MRPRSFDLGAPAHDTWMSEGTERGTAALEDRDIEACDYLVGEMGPSRWTATDGSRA
jgi:hypothetical protein